MGDLLFAILLIGAGFASGYIYANRTRGPADPEAPARMAAQMRTEDRLAVTSLIKEGRKIEAIKEVRERTRSGLAEAKAIVDHLETSDPASGIA